MVSKMNLLPAQILTVMVPSYCFIIQMQAKQIQAEILLHSYQILKSNLVIP